MKVELEKILSVAGKPGIYKILSSGKSAIIVESLIDGKRIPVHPTQKISTLSDISMFTLDEDVPLRDVLLKAKAVFEGGAAPDTKGDGPALRKTMEKILPDYDKERVYESDIRKLLMWYNVLQSRDMLDFAEPVKGDQVESEELVENKELETGEDK